MSLPLRREEDAGGRAATVGNLQRPIHMWYLFDIKYLVDAQRVFDVSAFWQRFLRVLWYGPPLIIFIVHSSDVQGEVL